MKAWSVIGLLFAAAIFATIPISPQVTPRGVELSVDQAQAQTLRALPPSYPTCLPPWLLRWLLRCSQLLRRLRRLRLL